METGLKILKQLFMDTRCIIAFVLVLNYCLAIWVVPTEKLSIMEDIIKMVLCFYFGLRSAMTEQEIKDLQRTGG